MEREVRYCTTTDGVRIAYCVEGEGPPLLVLPFFVASFSLSHLVPTFGNLMRKVGRGRQLIQFDLRGTGVSQREVDDLSHAATLRDIDAVVKAVGLKRFSIWGSAIGGPRAIEYTACHARQVERLVLSGTFARLLDVFAREMLQGFEQAARANWEVASRTFADLGIRRRDEQEGLRLAEWYRQSISGETMAALIETHLEVDVRALLPRVKCPTMILQYIEDPLYPFTLARQLAEVIPHASLVPLAGAGSGWTGYTEATIATMDSFLRGGQAPSVHTPDFSPSVRTVLFTDIVGHTEMMRRLGDQRGREVLREHERLTREVLKSHGGTEIKTMGDGFMASFGSVTKGVECAVALQRAFDERNLGVGVEQLRDDTPNSKEPSAVAQPLQVRVGLNAGEPIAEEGPDGRASGPVWRDRDPGRADSGEGGGWGDPGVAGRARAVRGQGIPLRRPGGACAARLRGTGAGVRGEMGE